MENADKTEKIMEDTEAHERKGLRQYPADVQPDINEKGAIDPRVDRHVWTGDPI